MNEPEGLSEPDPSSEPARTRGLSGVWRIGHAEFDEASGCLTVAGQVNELDHSGHQLLSYFLHNAGKVVAKDLLLKVGWPGRMATESSLTKAIHRLRHALRDPDGNVLCTVHGYGYRLAARAEYVPTPGPERVEGALTTESDGASSESATAPKRVLHAAGWIGLVISLIATIAIAVVLASNTEPAKQANQAPPDVALPSILVLPFKDLSQARDQSYMADGITEELQNRLGQARSLRVIGRTTSFTMAQGDVDVREVGKTLRVSHILQGSVRTSGDRIRITTRLVRTLDAVDVWSETYDRGIGDVFALQDEISNAVAIQLRVRLLGQSRARHRPDPRAYALVQQSRQLERLGIGKLDDYGPLIRQAVAIDPKYSDAWYIQGNVYLDEVNAGRRAHAEGLRLARASYEQALSLDPENVVVYALLGNFAYFYEGNPARGAQYFEQALAIEPGNLKVLFMGAALANALGRPGDATRAIEYVVERDPVDAQTQSVLGYFYYRAHRWDDAIARFQTALALSADMQYVNAALGDALRHKGQPRAALAAYEKEKDERYRLYGLVLAYDALGQKAESDQALRTLLAKYGAVKDDGESYWLIATALAQLGDTNDAFSWLGKTTGLDLHDLVNNVELAPLHSDRRWLPFLRKNDKSPEQLALLHQIKFDLKVPPY